jgi:glycosyltransferase involved in cell wall biosynthesis
VKTPLVSICIPAFRAEKYLQETLDSIRAQTFTDWEVILTEDGSKDRVEEMTRAFALTVAQTVTYSRHDVNQGLPATRNTGIALARGEFVALLDSDDYWAPTHLADLVATQRARNLDFVHSGSILFDNDTKATLELRRPTQRQVERFPLSLYAEGYVIQPSSVMVRKTVFEKLGGYDVSFRYCEDIELWFRAAKNGVTFGFTGNDTCHYRKHGGALTAHGGPMAFAAARAYVKHFNWPTLPASIRKERTSSQLASAGRIYLRSEPGRAWGFFREAWHRQKNLKYLGLTWVARAFAQKQHQKLQAFVA